MSDPTSTTAPERLEDQEILRPTREKLAALQEELADFLRTRPTSAASTAPVKKLEREIERQRQTVTQELHEASALFMTCAATEDRFREATLRIAVAAVKLGRAQDEFDNLVGTIENVGVVDWHLHTTARRYPMFDGLQEALRDDGRLARYILNLDGGELGSGSEMLKELAAREGVSLPERQE